MPPNVQTLQIGSASDGTGATPTNSPSMRQNDAYFLDKIAERWAKDTHIARSGATYRLDRLPSGFAGFERTRDGTLHVDRYLYGHPAGVFRSVNELYPHFKHLQDFGGPVGCPCKLCTGASKKKASASNSNASGSPDGRSHFFSSASNASTLPRPKIPVKISTKNRPGIGFLQGRPLSDSLTPEREQQADDEGTQDAYRLLLDKLKKAQPGTVRERIVDSMSPDWRAGHGMLDKLIQNWQALPNYVPRVGELVLFSRKLQPEHSLALDRSSATLRCIDYGSGAWLERPQWEVGVVTQMPTENVTDFDLDSSQAQKKQNIIYSGFRIEPLSQPSSGSKPFTQQRKYVPLHLLRPFCFWKECLDGLEEKDWHPTVRHALTVASSFCLVGKYEFRGSWPDATVFAKGVFLGSELIMIGDRVRLTPRSDSDHADVVTDHMVITSIRLRFVNLEDANNNDYDEKQPYNTCLHICGNAYTLDQSHSFSDSGKALVPRDAGIIPAAIAEYGQWYHMIDPGKSRVRLEVPYTRVLGRCYDFAAMTAWFQAPDNVPPPSSFSPVNRQLPSIDNSKVSKISQGLAGVLEARAFSSQNDTRIDVDAGKRWFWAETRIEQLDLHEVNGQFVGDKDKTRSTKRLRAWRQALKVLDGKKGAVEEYQAARTQQQQLHERMERDKAPASPWGMMASTYVGAEIGTDNERGGVAAGEGNTMDLDDDDETPRKEAQGDAAAISLVDDDSDDFMED